GMVSQHLTEYQALCRDGVAKAAIASESFARWADDVGLASTTDAGMAAIDAGKSAAVETGAKSMEVSKSVEVSKNVEAAKLLLGGEAFSRFITDAEFKPLEMDAGFSAALQNDVLQHVLADTNVRGFITS